MEWGSLWWPDAISQHKNSFAATEAQLNDALCKYCRFFFDTWNGATNRLLQDEEIHELRAPHHDTIDKLENSASQGCHLCGLFISIAHVQFEAKENDNNSGFYSFYDPKGIITLDHVEHDFWTVSVEMSTPELISVNLIPQKPAGWTSSINNFQAGSHFNKTRLGCKEDSLQLARRWIAECSINHEACRQKDQNQMPTRLVKIEESGIRLCLTAEQDNCSVYTTLSHCWGSISTLRLMKGNYSDFLRQIPYSSICKTFRDAIDIARALEFSWIWIDSLCIIQDDPADWQRESALMSNVYGSSSLNLAATAAPDGRKGCLFDRDPIQLGTQIETKLNENIKIYHCFHSYSLRYNLELAPLANRAWVLQERLLACRTLHFATSQIFWECKTKLACESFPDEISPAVCNNADSSPIQSFWASWPSIVKRYSKLELTVPSDKLVAIAGIARRLGQKSGDEYLAGLWRRTFLEGLCWFTDSVLNSDKSVRNRDVRVPSWSWAAVQIPIYMPNDEFKLLKAYINILDVSIQTVDGDLFSGVQGGTLTIKTKDLLRILIKSNCWHDFTASLSSYRHKKDFSNTLYWDVILDQSDGFMFLPIGIFSGNLVGLYGLVLRETGIENGQYERVGFFALRGGFKDHLLEMRWNSLKEDLLAWKEGALPKEQDYVSVEVDEIGTTWYTITII